MKQLEVPEYGEVRYVALDPPQRDALLGCGGEISILPETGTESLWRLRAGSHVGTVVVPGLTIRIRPKVPIARLFLMLSAATGSIKWDTQATNLDVTSTIEEVIATVLLDAIARALPSGLLRGYVEVEEESCVVRGRVNLSETLRGHPATLIPVTQSPELHVIDIAENRILAAALRYLLRCHLSHPLRARVMDTLRHFAEVTPLPTGTPIPRIAHNRLNAKWWDAIELAVLILKSSGLDLPAGLHRSNAFLVDMNVVFERFVYQALAAELSRRGLQLQHNRGGLYLDMGQNHGLRPDLSIWSGGRCVFAGDCKYKYSADADAQRSDLYQCLAYAAATNLSRIMLIYCGPANAMRDVVIANHNMLVQARTVHLACEIDRLRNQFASIASEVARTFAVAPLRVCL